MNGMHSFTNSCLRLRWISNEAISQLTSLAEHGCRKPTVLPKLVDQRQAAEMLGIGLSNFKRLEASGAFPFKRKKVGSAIRYKNTDIYDFINSDSKALIS